MPPPGARSLPLFPVAQPHSSPNPLVQLQHLSVGVADSKIVQPAHRVTPKLFHSPGHRNAPAATGDLLNPFLEPPQRLLRPHHLGPANSKAEKGTCAQRRGLT